MGNNKHFERVPKIILHFGGTNNIFAGCKNWRVIDIPQVLQLNQSQPDLDFENTALQQQTQQQKTFYEDCKFFYISQNYYVTMGLQDFSYILFSKFIYKPFISKAKIVNS